MYDVVFVSEIKSAEDVHVNGYRTFRDGNRFRNRGGILALVKDHLAGTLNQIDYFEDSAIWMNFKTLPDIVVGGIYIPPRNSTYFDDGLFANIQEMVTVKYGDKYAVVMGDMNAHLGDYRTLSTHQLPDIHYTPSEDTSSNMSGRVLRDLCDNNNLLVLNNLVVKEKELWTGLTFHRKNRWISEIDHVMCHSSLINHIQKLVSHKEFLPSDHAPIGVTVDVSRFCQRHLKDLVADAERLGETNLEVVRQPALRPTRKPIHRSEVDTQKLTVTLDEINPFEMIDVHSDSIDTTTEQFTSQLYHVSQTSRVSEDREGTSIHGQRRWKHIMESRDPKLLWSSIGWDGTVRRSDNTPSDGAFKDYFERLLSNDDTVEEFTCTDSPYIPVLDDDISASEYDAAIRKLKANKAPGCDGLSPGILKCLPVVWIVFVISMMNVVFRTGVYPIQWSYSKLVTVFKKGSRDICENYRGIAISDSLCKLYETILTKRFSMWYRAEPEQAGAQLKRGCLEHILALRLLIEFAKSRRFKLWILFVDFSKAYDRVSRLKMLEELKKAGCGQRFLLAIKGMYNVTKFVLKSATISVTTGVKQGAPLSCLLFIFYIDKMIRRINSYGTDGFLGTLNTLLLMDDTIIVATSREAVTEKFGILQSFCADYDMEVNDSKTKFMVINSCEDDKAPLTWKGQVVDYSSNYWYLGSVVTDDGNPSTVAKLHAAEKSKHLLKFFSFLRKNPDMPFLAKRMVADACVVSALTYGVETWMTANFKAMDTLYHRLIKALLGVRSAIPNDMCLLEAGFRPLRERILQSRASLMRTLPDEPDVPVNKALVLISSITSHRWTSFQVYQGLEVADLSKQILNKQDKSRFADYVRLNPSLTPHRIYAACVPDNLRIAYTRLILSSHRLRSETGRWTRPITPREKRLCGCGPLVQDERHVLTECERTDQLRADFGITDCKLEYILRLDPLVLGTLIHNMFKLYS